MPSRRGAGPVQRLEIVAFLGTGELRSLARVETHGDDVEIFARREARRPEAFDQSVERQIAEHRTLEVDHHEDHGAALPEEIAQPHGIALLVVEFQFERHLLAANGYAVLNVNYRGSAGRDEAYQTAIFADWGNKEVVDLLAAVDQVIAMGIADPRRLGIGGWSYGGILTDYTIATDARFKAAISGAGSALQISMYGSDQYIEQYDHEVGLPWESREAWLKISYPFFRANKIKTPTLFLGGERTSTCR